MDVDTAPIDSCTSNDDQPCARPEQSENDEAIENCVSFYEFMQMMENICKRYATLNPLEGDLFKHLKSSERPDGYTLNDTGMEFIRGGIVATVVAWEKYVQDVFKEAFDIIIQVSSNKQENIENLWHKCDVKAAIEKGRKRLKNREDQEDWKKCLEAHSKNVLECRTVLPIFLGREPEKNEPMTIDTLFMQLFQVERGSNCISQLLIEIGAFNYTIRLNPKDRVSIDLRLNDATGNELESAIKALNNISRLYYGLRCTLVHGNNKKTLDGSLKDFPVDEENFSLPTTCKDSTTIAKHYIRLYMWIKKYGREVWVNYLTLLNITRFYKAAAHSLMLTLAKFLYDCSTTDSREGILIWKFDPKRLKSKMSALPELSDP